jgi:signal transduction histidine kinase
VTIDDTGRGIPPQQVAKIFLPFFTTKTHGTGLGLALVQKIILAHNGKIEVQSTEGKGTRFAITLPRVNTAPSSDLSDAALEDPK